MSLVQRRYARDAADQALRQAAAARRRVREAIDRRNPAEARHYAAEAHRHAGKARVLEKLMELDRAPAPWPLRGGGPSDPDPSGRPDRPGNPGAQVP